MPSVSKQIADVGILHVRPLCTHQVILFLHIGRAGFFFLFSVVRCINLWREIRTGVTTFSNGRNSHVVTVSRRDSPSWFWAFIAIHAVLVGFICSLGIGTLVDALSRLR